MALAVVARSSADKLATLSVTVTSVDDKTATSPFYKETSSIVAICTHVIRPSKYNVRVMPY